MKLLLIRHAESQGNFEHRLQGRREFPLTELGKAQADALASRVAALELAAIYSSPIGRAMETAEVIAAKVGLEVIPEPRVQEYDFGEAVSGLTWDEIREGSPEVEAMRNNESEFPRYPGEEGRAAFQERVRAALAGLTERHAGDQCVAVVTHAGPITVMLLDALARPYSRPIPFVLDNASVTTMEFNGRVSSLRLPPVVVTGINDGCHVDHLKSADRAGGGA